MREPCDVVLPPHPIQHTDESVVVVRAPGLLRELADGEVGLLLAGAGFAEGHAPYPYRRRTMAGMSVPLRT